LVSILATRYNNLQSRIQAVYGDAISLSSGTGYGQTVRSSQVVPLTFVDKTFDPSTDVNYSTDTITISGHNLIDKQFVRYNANGNTPIVEEMNEHSHYYVKVIDGNNIQLYLDESFTRQLNFISGASSTHILTELDAESVEAEDYFNLYKDIVGARIHQVGPAFTIGNSAALAIGDVIAEPYLQDLETLMSSVETDRLLIADPSQVSEEILRDGTNTPVTSVRTSAWNGTRSHEINLTFPTQGQQTGYWNAAGEIIFTPSLTGYSGSKSGDWATMLSGIGSITFDRTGVNVSGVANFVDSTITPYNLTTSYQVLAERFGASYANNRFRIYAKRNSNNQLGFKVEFADLDSPGGFGVDENVNGTLTSLVELYRPLGTMIINGVTYDTVTFDVTGLTVQSL
jgi:hypothetical protein